MQAKVDSFTPTVYRSIEELQHDISARGLNMRSFGQLLIEAHNEGEFNAGENDDSDASNGASGKRELS